MNRTRAILPDDGSYVTVTTGDAAERDAARGQLAYALAVLRRVEWVAGWGGMYCKICGRLAKEGHAPDCPLARVLAYSKGDPTT